MLENQNIGTKLTIGFGIITLIAVAIGVVAVINTRALAGAIREIGENRLPSVQALKTIANAQTTIDSAENALLYHKSTPDQIKATMKRFDDAHRVVESAWKRYEGLAMTTEETKLWETFAPAWKAWIVDHNQYVQMAKAYWNSTDRKEADYEKMAEQALITNYKTFDPAMAALDALVLYNEQRGAEEVRNAGATVATAQFMIWSAIAGGVILAIILALLITRAITRPVAMMCETLGRVADGDLTVSTGISQKDEIGQMAASLDTTVANLAAVMTDIREAADQTAASGEELSATAQNISSGAQTQASTVEEISASVQELSKSISLVATSAGAANQVAQATSTTATQGRQSVDRSIDGMKAINDSSTQIAKIIGVINQIANQTNLLALNAAIEAASAGEHGLGFAVVADEVRKLAERSSQAAQEIAQLIDESGKRVNEGSNLSQEVGKSLSAILEGITKTTEGMAGISASTEEQSSTAREVTTNIEGISAITEENSASAEEMAASAEELSAQAQRLQELVSRFRLNEEPAAKPMRRTAVTKTATQSPMRKTSSQLAANTPAKRKTAVIQGDEEQGETAGKALYHE